MKGCVCYVSCLFNAYIYIKYFYSIKFQYEVYIVTNLYNAGLVYILVKLEYVNYLLVKRGRQNQARG